MPLPMAVSSDLGGSLSARLITVRTADVTGMPWRFLTSPRLRDGSGG